MDCNILGLSDSYKYTHAQQYPPGTENVYSYLESRGGRYPGTIFFGLQYILKKYLTGSVVTDEKITEAEDIINSHMGKVVFNRAGWEYIVDEYGGKLPIKIKAVKEGTIVPTHNVLMTICNTDPNVFWLSNWLETLLLQIWYPITVATQSREIRKLMDIYAENNGDLSGVPFKLHDFGFRGVSSVESAGIGGAAHGISFQGSDTVAAITMLRKYYGAKMPLFSIPASEHSTITSWGKDHEVDAMKNMLLQYPDGVIACVSDSFNVYEACENIWGGVLKDEVMKRNGTLVCRPDSGNPIEIVMSCLEILDKKFGHTINSKGYKVLDPHIRIIQGDGVDQDVIEAILGAMDSERWSIDNIAFGMGGALLQKLNRDTQKFAIKCSAIRKDGFWYDVYKDPITSSSKRSKAGRLKLIKVNEVFKTVRKEDPGDDLLEDVFINGDLIREQTLDEIRQIAGTLS